MCTELHHNSFNNCQGILLKATNVNLMVALQEIGDHSLAIMNVCPEFHGNPSQSCRDISI